MHGLGGVVLEQTDLCHPLCPLGRLVTAITRIGACGDGVEPGTGGLDAHLHVHQLVANHLVVNQRSAEGLALLCPTQCFVVAAFREAQGHSRHGQALPIEVGQDDLEARALFAHQVAGGYPHTVKADLRGVGAQPAHLLEWAARQTYRITRHHQHGDAHGALVLQVGAHCHRDPVGPHTGRDENLFTVHHVLIAFQSGGGLERGHIGAAAGFGNGQRGNLLAGQHIGYHLLLQGRAAVAHHWGQSNVVAEQAGHQAAAATRTRQGNRHGIAKRPRRGCAAKCFRVAHGEPAQVGSALVEAARELARFFPGFQVRLDFSLDEAARGVFYLGDVFLIDFVD